MISRFGVQKVLSLVTGRLAQSHMCTVLASRLNLGFNCSCEMPTYIACTMSQWGQKLSPGRARTRNTHVMREVS